VFASIAPATKHKPLKAGVWEFAPARNWQIVSLHGNSYVGLSTFGGKYQVTGVQAWRACQPWELLKVGFGGTGEPPAPRVNAKGNWQYTGKVGLESAHPTFSYTMVDAVLSGHFGAHKGTVTWKLQQAGCTKQASDLKRPTK
jgi:hypothetical protein